MTMTFSALILHCRKSKEIIAFSRQLTVFHGPIAAGKSSIARLIAYCLGDDLERTAAIQQELVSVELIADLNGIEAIFAREAQRSNQVQVTWRDKAGEAAAVLAPVSQPQNAQPIWGEHIFTLSDLIFHLLGMVPPKVHRSSADEESPLVRLSFRNFMWYCYLEQKHLDSSFFALDNEVKRPASRNVMRYVMGYYSEALSVLEKKKEATRLERLSAIETAKRLRKFIEQFGYGSTAEVEFEIAKVQSELSDALQQVRVERDDYRSQTHFADELRAQLRELARRLEKEERALIDLDDVIKDQEMLKAELISTKFKVARATSATTVLSGVAFESCPSCGTDVERLNHHGEECVLCGTIAPPKAIKTMTKSDAMAQDLDARIAELDESITRHKTARTRQRRRTEEIRVEKSERDARLLEEMTNYDSAFLSRSRELERAVATLQERIKGLERVRQMPEAITHLQEDAEKLRGDEETLARQIEEERQKLCDADLFIKELEEAYREALVEVGVPGVKRTDSIVINRKTWMPKIVPHGGRAPEWGFENAGSGGKATLLNVCYALAIHKVAAVRGLPLPEFLLIDSPMKNISTDVNKDKFVAFYHYLYKLIRGPLAATQVIVIDQEFIPPDGDDIEVRDRFMTPDDDMHPPLISYYRD